MAVDEGEAKPLLADLLGNGVADAVIKTLLRTHQFTASTCLTQRYNYQRRLGVDKTLFPRPLPPKSSDFYCILRTNGQAVTTARTVGFRRPCPHLTNFLAFITVVTRLGFVYFEQ
jgi:hypothetical protein